MNVETKKSGVVHKARTQRATVALCGATLRLLTHRSTTAEVTCERCLASHYVNE